MLDDRFEDRLQEAARDYNVPPETPRDAMWAAIQSRRTESTEKTERTGGQADRRTGGRDGIPLFPRTAVPPYRRLLPWSAGIAALLALGFALGRLTQRPEKPAAPAVATAEAAPKVADAAYRVATTEHLSHSEAFLTLFRASVRQGGDEQLASTTARQLLATNRLLLDSPAASDARTRLLLQDLELVLAEIAQLSPRPRGHDLDLISEGLEQGGVLSRLRTAVPSGASPTQGAL
jgi:hypothetical protein